MLKKNLLWVFAAFMVFQGISFASEEECDAFKMVHNLSWIYADLGLDDGEHISSEGDMFNCAEKWAKLNPGFEIHMNYDRASVSKPALRNTIKRTLKSPYKEQIKIRNLRKLPFIAKNSSAFIKQRLVAPKSDLARNIKSYYDLVNGNFSHSSYADLDVVPVSLFPIIKEKQEDLENYGMVMAKEGRKHKNGHSPGWENCFHIFYADQDFLYCLNRVLIQPSILRLQLLSHIEGNDDEFSKKKVVQEFMSLTKITNLKKRFNKKSFLSNKEHVYERYEIVLLALHGRKGREVYGTSSPEIKGEFPMLFLDFKKEIARVMLETMAVCQQVAKASFDYCLFNPIAKIGIYSPMEKNGIKFRDEKRIYVPITSEAKFPPSKILEG